jgi:hypothetical protein
MDMITGLLVSYARYLEALSSYLVWTTHVISLNIVFPYLIVQHIIYAEGY